MRHTERRFRLYLLFGVILGALATSSCGEQESPAPGEGGETLSQEACPEGQDVDCIDETLSCPEGQVGWRFKSRLSTTDRETSDRAGETQQLSINERRAISVTQVTCPDSDFEGVVRATCDGEYSCELVNHCLSGSMQVSYKCGIHGDESREITFSDRSQAKSFSCEQPEKTFVEREKRVACIPRQCHGRARRNLDMECVEDATKRETVVEAKIVKSFTPLYKAQSDHNLESMEEGNFIPGDDPKDVIYPNLPYELTVQVDIGGAMPEKVSFVGWMTEEFAENAAYSHGGALVHAYRCVAFKFDVEKDGDYREMTSDSARTYRRYTKTLQVVFTEECIEGYKLARQNAARDTGLLSYSESNGYNFSSFTSKFDTYRDNPMNLHLSYDLEGRTVWHKGLSPDSGGETIAEHEPECVPNPVDFFYDSPSRTYEMREYYAQRALDLGSAKYKDYYFARSGKNPQERRGRILERTFRRAEIGFDKLEARNDLVIRTASEIRPTLRVDFGWHAVNFTDFHTYNPFIEREGEVSYWDAYYAEHGGQPSVTPPLDAIEGLDFYDDLHFAPTPRVRFRFSSLRDYMIGPWIESENFALEDGVPLGKTDTYTLQLDNDAAQSLVDALKRRDQAVLKLWACPDLPGVGWNVEPGVGANVDNYPQLDRASGDWGDSSHHPQDALSFYNTRRGVSGDRRCTATTVSVRVDRFATPVTPISSVGFAGSQSQTKTGDSSMSGGSDSDSQVTCEGDTQTNCTEVYNTGSRTEGEDNSSFFNIEARSQRNPGDKVSGMVTGTMFGFDLLSQGDPGASTESDFPVSASVSSSGTSFTIAPPWESIEESLNAGTRNPKVKWHVGDYPDETGLGIGWGHETTLVIGPVPVQVSIMATVGASMSLKLEFTWAPDDDQRYPCLDSDKKCLVVHSQAASFSEAVETCTKLGGRLAELSSSAEAQAVDDALSSGSVWVGGQLAYRHPDTQCATAYNAQKCQPDSRTEYRWMSNEAAFASNTGTDAPTYTTSEFSVANSAGLSTRYPNDAAVYYSSNKSFGVAKTNQQRPFMCAYEPAARQDFLEWSIGLKLGAAAGLNLEGCAPSSTVGGCLGGQFNIVGVTFEPTLKNTFHWLYETQSSTSPFGRRGATSFTVPWALKLFSGSVTFSVKLLWISISSTVASYDGITVAEGSLYDWTIPTMENF